MIPWYRFLDWLGSAWRRGWKTLVGRRRWGPEWRDKTRRGRRFTHLEYVPPVTATGVGFYNLRKEPGWEWWCPNCKTYSIITAAMMPEILKDWAAKAQATVDRGYPAPVKPTIATAGCTNCRYRPGAPE